MNRFRVEQEMKWRRDEQNGFYDGPSRKPKGAFGDDYGDEN